MAKKAAKPDLQLVVDNSQGRDEAAEKHAESPEQVEMPFAIVNGEAVTQLPKDLYIPPQALEVFLEAFEGPLDLLLYMIRRQNLDILDIPIADITRQYMEYIGLMQELQLELAGEYLVMAATLAEIKSRMLLPRAVDPNAGEEGDPVFPELVAYVESGLRVDDSVFRMTRERVVLLLTDVQPAQAQAIVERLREEFAERFPAAEDVACDVHEFEVTPETIELTLRQALLALFPLPPEPH